MMDFLTAATAPCPEHCDPVEWERHQRDNAMEAVEREQAQLYRQALLAGGQEFIEPEPSSCPPGVDPTEWGRHQLDNWLEAFQQHRTRVVEAFLRVDMPQDQDETWPMDARDWDERAYDA